MNDVFLHNPRCSKSRAALELVRVSGVELPVREYLHAMAAHPILIERPIVVGDGRAVVGRPPETVRELLPENDRHPER